MTNVINNIIMIYYYCYIYAFISILPNGNMDLIAYTIACLNFDQRRVNICNCCCHLTSLWFSGGYYLMSCIKDVPTLRGDNYTEWRKKVDFACICAEVDWVVGTPQPVKPTEPVRDAKDDDAAWDKKKKDYAPLELSYFIENQKWHNANKKCMAFIKNTVENAIVGSIE